MTYNHPDPLDEGLRSAADDLQRGRFKTAVKTLRDLIEKFPNSPQVFHDLGVAYMMRLKADVQVQEYWENLADDEQVYQEAHDAFSRAIEIDPNFLGSLNNLGALEVMRGNLDRGIELWERSLSLNPSQPAVRDDLKAALAARERNAPPEI